jgi:hypothetical protein
MKPTEEAPQAPTCIACRVAVERCGCCERVECPETICSRCLRIQLRESLPQLHVHGG